MALSNSPSLVSLPAHLQYEQETQRASTNCKAVVESCSWFHNSPPPDGIETKIWFQCHVSAGFLANQPGLCQIRFGLLKQLGAAPKEVVLNLVRIAHNVARMSVVAGSNALTLLSFSCISGHSCVCHITFIYST